jgi:hypothetical protein
VTNKDPKQELWDKLGDLSEVEVFNNQVLVAVYIRPTTTTLGGKAFYLTDKAVDEDRYQSKVAMIIKKGPQAFKDANGVWFAGTEFNLGDLIVYRASDGLAMELRNPAAKSVEEGKVLCRLLEDTSVRMRVGSVSRVW